MNASISLKLFDISQEFIKDKEKAREFVAKIEKTIDDKFNAEKLVLTSKIDLLKMETRIKKNIYLVGLIQFIAIVGSVLAIVSFMIK